MLEVSKKIQINPDIILRGINSKYWALNTRSGAQYRLNNIMLKEQFLKMIL